MLQRERIAGGLYGLLVGDALGVPYEFYEAKELPVYEKIEMTPPAGFQKTYPRFAAGTWSDDVPYGQSFKTREILSKSLFRRPFSLV